MTIILSPGKKILPNIAIKFIYGAKILFFCIAAFSCAEFQKAHYMELCYPKGFLY